MFKMFWKSLAVILVLYACVRAGFWFTKTGTPDFPISVRKVVLFDFYFFGKDVLVGGIMVGDEESGYWLLQDDPSWSAGEPIVEADDRPKLYFQSPVWTDGSYEAPVQCIGQRVVVSGAIGADEAGAGPLLSDVLNVWVRSEDHELDWSNCMIFPDREPLR